MSSKKGSFSYVITILKGIFGLLFVLAGIFLLAGSINYWQGWVFVGVIILGIPFLLYLFKDKKDLAKERIKPGPGTKLWDKIFWVFYGPTFMAIYVIAILDSGRYMWSPDFPIYIYILGYIAFLISNIMYTWAMYVNKWFSSVVRIQKDRNQKVCQDGPYKYVRHPGYTGGILMALSSSIIFGSLWGLIPAGLVVIMLIIRTYLEDITLQKELPGYKDFTKKTKFRLIPGLW